MSTPTVQEEALRRRALEHRARWEAQRREAEARRAREREDENVALRVCERLEKSERRRTTPTPTPTPTMTTNGCVGYVFRVRMADGCFRRAGVAVRWRWCTWSA